MNRTAHSTLVVNPTILIILCTKSGGQGLNTQQPRWRVQPYGIAGLNLFRYQSDSDQKDSHRDLKLSVTTNIKDLAWNPNPQEVRPSL